MISFTPNIEHARAIVPSLAVFSRRWGVSEITDAGIATEKRVIMVGSRAKRALSAQAVEKMNFIARDRFWMHGTLAP